MIAALRWIHISAGTLALVLAPLAMLTVKGGRAHRRWGQIYFWSMAVVAATAAVLALWRPQIFLALLAVFSFYLAFTGYRSLWRKRPAHGERATAADWAAAAGTFVTSAALAVLGLVRPGPSWERLGIVPVVFGALGMVLAGVDLARFARPPADPRAWWFAHMGGMLGSYIAAVSAFSVVNFTFLPTTARWLWPTALGVPLISIWSRTTSYASATPPARAVRPPPRADAHHLPVRCDNARPGGTMANAEFGIFDWIDRREHGQLGQLYEDRLELLAQAEAAGFFCYHLAEHHATPLGMAPSPSVFLAAAAQRTRRIRLGPLVYLLPLYSPLRLIGEICMLDNLSGGRLELGVGRGVSPYEVGYHGFDPSRTRAMFQEALEVIVAGLTSPRLTYRGEHYRYDDVPMELAPAQRPYPPLWYATSNLESVPWAASQGMNFVGLGPAQMYRPFVEKYRAVWPTHRDDPKRLNAHVRTPRIGINRQVVVAETDKEAETIARTAHPRWAASFVKLWADHGDTTYAQRVNLDAALQHETILVGSPARVRDQVARLIETTGANYVICCFAWGDLTQDQSRRSLNLFAEKVMPAFKKESA